MALLFSATSSPGLRENRAWGRGCSSRLSRLFFVKRNWLWQMVDAITEGNEDSSILHSVHHLSKPWSDRFTHLNIGKVLCPKACDTASSHDLSHRYLSLGTFRQRAVRGGCIADYRVFQKFVPIVNCILRKEFNASLGKCKLIQAGNLSK